MPSSTGRFLIYSLIVAVLSGLLLVPGLPGDFVFDDVPNIADNPAVHMNQLDADSLARVIATPQVSGTMRVLPTLTFAIDHWRAGGADPKTFKITNIVIHALTTCALAWFFRSLLLIANVSATRSRWAALALALAWAIHPLQVSSVLYVVQRLQTMGTLFLILALLAYIKARQAQIEGRPARTNLLIALLLWVLAMGCKEDSVLLPAYTLAVELTVLRFDAANTRMASILQRGYLIAALAGISAYVLWAIPHYWHWEAYPGRDFSTPERMLTQARVLCMYLWQILLPLPSHMPFYYDWLQPSRSLLQPWTTLIAIATLLALLGTAWRLRARRPLFSLGVLLFFGAHFISSNVVGLELAFEHRNHFAMIGAVLAVGSLLGHAGPRLRLRPAIQAALCALLLGGLGGAMLLRAHSWHSGLTLARTSTELAPGSARAWISLCMGYFESGGGAVRDNPLLGQAIETCESGTASAPDALNNFALLIVLKTVRGDVADQDWTRFQQKVQTVTMGAENRMASLVLIKYARGGVPLDKQELIRTLDALVRRVSLQPFVLSSIGYFVMNDLAEPDSAMPYFARAIGAAHFNDPFPQQLAAELRGKGRPDLAAKIDGLGLARIKAAAE